jgi:two-component system sensor histidine kinase BarA
MASRWTETLNRWLHRARLKPISLAAKFRLQFGLAILLSLTVALYIPYLWMDKLTEKIALDAGRAVSATILERHFQAAANNPKGLPILGDMRLIQDPNQTMVGWIRLGKPETPLPINLESRVRRSIETLRAVADREETAWTNFHSAGPVYRYVRIVRSGDFCLTCHTAQGSASPFTKNEVIGAIQVQIPARERAKTILINRIAAILAGLLAATAAMVAFYAITQRTILRPIRQLRAMANNIADGNLELRSALKSGDEFEKLSEAFNHMLDVLQESQTRLRHANVQLDAKIAELSERNIELFRANKLKGEFLANMSHEVRTPLNAILGFAQLLHEKPAADLEKSRRYAQNIIASGRALLNLINDLLDLAKAEAGKMELHIEKTALGSLCESIAEFFAPISMEKEQEVTLSVDPDIPLLLTDPGKLRQILSNLFSNAVKFTPAAGRIRLAAALLDDKTVRIVLADNGPGIAKENHQTIFEKFRQVDGSITRPGQGTGLGLAISRELTSLLSGTIWVESELGQGATFFVDLPIVTPTTQPNPS